MQETLNCNHGILDLTNTSPKCHTCSKIDLASLPSIICNRIILTLTQLSYMNRTCKNLELTHASSTCSKHNTNLINKFQIEVLRNHFDEYYAILHDWEPDSMMGWIYCTERSCSIIVKYLYGFNISFYSEGDWQMLLNMTVAKALFDCEGVLASILS